MVFLLFPILVFLVLCLMQEVIIQMIPVCVFSLTATEPSIRARTALIWAQPKPKDVHTPKVVQEMDKASITSPAKPFVWSPINGGKALRMVIGKPCRWQTTPSVNAMTMYGIQPWSPQWKSVWKIACCAFWSSFVTGIFCMLPDNR